MSVLLTISRILVMFTIFILVIMFIVTMTVVGVNNFSDVFDIFPHALNVDGDGG